MSETKSCPTKKFQGCDFIGAKVSIFTDDENEIYRTTLVNFAKYHLIMFAMAKLMEMEATEQNKVAMYLFNCIKI